MAHREGACYDSINGMESALVSLSQTEAPKRAAVPFDKTSDRPRRRIRQLSANCWCKLYFLISATLLHAYFMVTFTIFANKLFSEPKLDGHFEEKKTNKNPYNFQRFSENAPVCHPVSAQDIAFTLVTQCSEDRLWMMEHHCQRWGPHPVSIAVYTDQHVDAIKQQLMELGCSAELLTVQTVSGYSIKDYPVNVLRNLALSTVQTTHVAYIDIDFWESTDLYDNLLKHRNAFIDLKTAVVIPAFQMHRQCQKKTDCREDNVPVMPATRDDLLNLYDDCRADIFDVKNTAAHGSTRHSDWAKQASEELLPIECVTSNRYEPYLVFRYCRDLPPFQEAFVGYGKNKVNWILNLRKEGWLFYQLGESFVVHYPHMNSAARKAWNGGKNGNFIKKPKGNDDGTAVDWLSYRRGQVDQLYVKYRQWLHETVPDQTRVPLCEEALSDDDKLWIEREQEGEHNGD